jgi:catechol 2,3-dioxygenase-like lactoylglutathione lyase family enzyme
MSGEKDVMKNAKFSAGRNIAMKVPPHMFDATVQFYRDVLGLREITKHAPSIGFEFGSNNLWIDRVAGMSQTEIWLEVVTNNITAAAQLLKNEGVVRCDEIEPLPDGFQAFWISSPASIVHLVCKDTESWA